MLALVDDSNSPIPICKSYFLVMVFPQQIDKPFNRDVINNAKYRLAKATKAASRICAVYVNESNFTRKPSKLDFQCIVVLVLTW